MKGLSILTDLFTNTQYFINTFDNKERGIIKSVNGKYELN